MSDRRFATHLLAFVVLASCTASRLEAEQHVSPASAETDDGIETDPPDFGAKLCAADSGALADARKRYDALGTLAKRLEGATPPTAFVKQAKALYEHECLIVGRADEPGLDLDIATGIEAKAYWEAGLNLWFRTYLAFDDGGDQTVWLLPSRPAVVTAETRPNDPLAPWMCSADPLDPCTGRVAAWRSRAQRDFGYSEQSRGPGGGACNPARNDWPEEDAYVRWRKCQKDGLAQRPTLPLGGVGVVEDGWIVVYGRRDASPYCKEVTAFDLSSGSHYRFSDCARRNEFGAAGITPPGISVETGMIPKGRLREFAWIALSGAYVEWNAVTEGGLARNLPSGMTIARPPASLSAPTLGLRDISRSEPTNLGWIWTRASGKTPAGGELTWPLDLWRPARDYAIVVLFTAENRSIAGCAAKKLPEWILENLTTDRLPKSEHGSVDPPSETILAAMRQQIRRGPCAK